MTKARDKQEFVITRRELRALLFWASVGVRESVGGSFSENIDMVIVDWATKLGLTIPYHLPYPEFGEARKLRKHGK